MALSKGFARNNAKTPLDQRLADMATIVCNTDGSPRVGVLGSANPSIVSHGGGMNLAVAAAEFVTSKGKADGVMIFTGDGAVNVLIGAAPASNSRIDVLWVKHFDDTTGDTAGQFLPLFGVTAGVAAASPVKLAIPTGALELATLRIYSGTVATNGGANVLTNTYQMTAGRGGAVPFRTIAERDAWTTAVDGQLGFVLASDALFHYLATTPTPGWFHVAGAPEIMTVTPGSTLASATGAADQGGIAQLRRHGGLIVGAGSLVNTGTYNVALGSSYIIGTISDATMRPDVDRFFATGTTSNAAAGVLKVGADGNISWRANAAASWTTGTLRIDLGGIVYTAKGLV